MTHPHPDPRQSEPMTTTQDEREELARLLCLEWYSESVGAPAYDTFTSSGKDVWLKQADAIIAARFRKQPWRTMDREGLARLVNQVAIRMPVGGSLGEYVADAILSAHPACGEGWRDAFPPHAASLHLTHNQHKAYYETVEEYTADSSHDSWVSEEQRAKAIASNDMWELQWYPDTPIGFYRLFAADLDVLLAASTDPPAQNGV